MRLVRIIPASYRRVAVGGVQGGCAELGAAWVRVVIVNHNAGPLLHNRIDALAAQSLAYF